MCLGIPGQIVAVADEDAMLCVVDVSGVRRSVDVVCVAEPGAPLSDLVGAWVLVHVGFAMSRIDEEEAAATLKVLTEIGEAAAEMEALTKGSVDLHPITA
ncbi:HypC/HybG/HupF family hydrogenase formation chaperone [Xanthobacter autotrophicus]|uniref:HypC/HybG/HupF family hydrogenase formation chaperone n=1 Tax=Xanthobacter TaxID=279 RepID=UPI0024AA5C9F|nr:HypC/HybG/HupF family hydrogenase formation chaperone [Xanthobacter autotrophicus]MDI4666009.1 HypC/HybG/HupF family hydrogenase formation chaperone [Xanthobacter autotrophicus]